MGGLIAYPLIYSLYISLTTKQVGLPAKFVGFQNYIDLIHATIFQHTVVNTIIYVLGAVVLKVLIGLAVALMLNQNFKFRNIARGIIFLPWIIPHLSIALTWRLTFDDQVGIFNYILQSMGIIEYAKPWLSDPILAKIIVISTNVWKGVPFFIMSTLAALQTIPDEIVESAAIDGAGPFRRFLHITIPHIWGVTLLIGTLSCIWTMNDFQNVFLVTMGGPGDATEIFATLTYREAFLNMSLGRGVAVSLFSLPIMLVLIFFATRTIYREE
jgi:ABC-type sugar transport system permease subunit